MKIALGALPLLVFGCAVNAQGPSAEDRLREISLEQVARYAIFNQTYLQSHTEKALIKASIETARNELKDPGGAQFRNVRVVQYGQGKVVCGEINGKNSYGG